MPHILSRCLVLVVILFSLLALSGEQSGQAEPLAAPTVTLVSPASCPPNGCAAGQRLNFKAAFATSVVDPNRQPTFQICVYAPGNWSALTSFEITPATPDHSIPLAEGVTNCSGASPSNTILIGGAGASLTAASVTDSFLFAFRLGAGATAAGAVIVRVFERDSAGNWNNTGEGQSSSISVTATSANVFVANDAATCGASNIPCYVNSGDDQLNGFGTGLKDAIEGAIAPATITVLGNYTIKQNQVLLDEPVTLKSGAGAKITYTEATNVTPFCNNPMLVVTAGASLSGLTLEDGSCGGSANATNRYLVLVNNTTSTSTVLIESSDLNHGLDGIHVANTNAAKLTVRYNDITNNAGWAIYMESSNTGQLNAYANNLYANRSGAQVYCFSAAKGIVDHNFWGPGVLASQGAQQCTSNDAKRLGAAIALSTSGAGVQAQQVTVTTSAIQYAFDNAVGYQRTGSGNDFGLVIVNHGYGAAANIPFTAGLLGNPTNCGNFYDVFLVDTTAPASPATLKLYFKYNLNSTCTATIESSQYCGQTSDSTKYPLYWFNQNANNWGTTGASGQTTTCRTDANKDISVTIDSSANRPNFTDLARMPIVVALPGQIVVSTISASAGPEQATINWVTADETNITGFYVERSEQANAGFTTVSDLITRKGTGNAGASYQYTDTGLTDYTTYYYHLKIMNADGSSFVSFVVSAYPIPATPTPTGVPTITKFPTSTFIYKSPTPTFTFTPTPTSPFKTITNTPLATITSATRPTSTTSPSPAPTTALPATALAQTRVARTESARLSETPTLTPTATPVPVSKQAEPLTVIMAVLAVGTLAGGAFYLLREQRLSH